jgi:hypothetical protein
VRTCIAKLRVYEFLKFNVFPVWLSNALDVREWYDEWALKHEYEMR